MTRRETEREERRRHVAKHFAAVLSAAYGWTVCHVGWRGGMGREVVALYRTRDGRRGEMAEGELLRQGEAVEQAGGRAAGSA
jgi:hypothetical protein